ncbi:MAG: GTP-binding protein [Planctomycetia bacterium]|nr:GTP-binding protein [Planctomycetia bacterium]
MANVKVGRISYGHWSSQQGEEVVVCRAGEREFDIHCHGGTAAVAAIVESLVDAGGKLVDWRAWLAGHAPDAIRRAALEALADARTERAAVVLLDQLAGALAHELQAIHAELARGELAAAASALRELGTRASVGLHLVTPFQVVLAGRPNVGKSSLINALVGYQRAIVFSEPGTTRDVVTAVTAIDGWPVELSDTAGLRETFDPVEEAGGRLARERLDRCDLVVLVFDASEASPDDDRRLQDGFPEALVVYNKCDVVGARALADTASQRMTSAVSGAGIKALVAEIGRRLVPTPPQAGAGVPFTRGQVDGIERALAAVEQNDAVLAMQSLETLLPPARDR